MSMNLPQVMLCKDDSETYKQQVEVGMQKTLKGSGILQLKDPRLQQVDKTKHVRVEGHVIP